MHFCTRFERLFTKSKSGEKQEEHVPRHIELTAVLKEISKQIIKSNRIERFEKTTRDFSQINKETRFIWTYTIYDEEFDPGSG